MCNIETNIQIKSMKPKSKKKDTIFNKIMGHTHDTVTHINSSKLFAGLMIIILNIASRFVTIKLSKSMESYLKNTFSKQILIFAIAWMGTRDIYIALLITIIFIICVDYLFHEESMFCCLPKSFLNYHINILDDKVSEEDIKKAKETLQKAESQKEKPAEDSNTQAPPTPTQSRNDEYSTIFQKDIDFFMTRHQQPYQNQSIQTQNSVPSPPLM